MKCLKHSVEAIAVCAYCGRALCTDCIQSPQATRMVCSSACATSLERNERTLHRLLDKSVQTSRASAFYCYLCGGLSAAAAVVAWFMLPSPFLILFTGATAVVLIVSGFWYGRGSKK